MDKVKDIGAFAKQLDKGQRQEAFEEGIFGEQTVIKKGHTDTKHVVIGKNTYRGFQAGRPGFDDGLQGHYQHANKYHDECRVGKIELNLAFEAFFQDNFGQLHAYKKLEAAAKEGVQQHKSEVAEETVKIDMAEDQYHANSEQRNHHRLDIKFVVFFN